MFSTIFKQGKTKYYNHYFEGNWNSIKNTRKVIKSILNIKTISVEIPKTHTVDGTLFPIQWKSPIFSTTIFLHLLVKRSLIFQSHINIFQIFLKIDLIFPFL